MVYITRGRGVFESSGVRLQTVEAGDLFFLFPGVWHRYTPDIKTGWDEQWLGFNGELAERFLNKPFFRRNKPLVRIGIDESLRQMFIGMVNTMIRDPAGAPFSSAGDIIKILGVVQEQLQSMGTNGQLPSFIREAQNQILRQASSRIDFENMAHSLGIGYSSFRHRFKQQTGVSPAQFQNSIRMNRAKDLLSSTELSVSEIAAQCGFETVYYFSRHFTQKMGITPSAYRKQSR
jgi:AraC-like DNA-binding protein